MNQRHTLGLTAAAATLLASLPMMTLFVSFAWFFYAALAVAVIEGCAILTRQLRGPVWVQILAMFSGLLIFLTFLFPSGGEWGRIIPSGTTFLHFNDLLAQAGEQIRSQSPPVPDLEGLLLLTTLGIGMVAILVDLAAVGLRRPALAGLPMLALYSVPVAVVSDGLSFVPFVAAAAGFIWLLVSDSVDRVRRFGRRFTGEGRDVDVWEASPLSSAGRRLGVIGVAFAILIPLAVPGMTAGLIDRFGAADGAGGNGGQGGQGGTGSTVDLTGFLQGQLIRDKITNMVKVTTNDPSPFYLRIGVADEVSLKGFASRAATGGPLSRIPADYTPPTAEGVTANRYHADIQILDLNMSLAPIYEQLVGVQGLGTAWFHELSTDQVFSRRESIANRQYGVDYVRVAYSPNALRTATPIAGNDPIRGLSQVPQIEYVTELVDQLTNGKATQYDQVRAVYDYFTNRSNNFVYSLTTGEGPNEAQIVNFLTAKKGFCVQYAAAMAWLVRAAGYPARVAFGFTRGNGMSNGVYTLNNFNLHAWTEVYFQDFGWVPFDATPSGSVVGTVRPAWAPDPQQPNQPGDEEDPDLGNNPTTAPSETPGAAPGDEGNDAGGFGIPINPWYAGGAAAAVLLLVLAFMPSLRRRALSRQRRTRAGGLAIVGEGRPPSTSDYPILDPEAIEAARRDAHLAWAELRDTMIDFQVDVDDAETPRATAERLNTLLASPTTDHTAPAEADVLTPTPRPRPSTPRHAVQIGDQTVLLSRAEERARYARHPLHPHGLDAAVLAIRDAFAARATRRQRLSARFMPRSVLQRWRLAWLGRLARTTARFNRVREGVAVINPRRLLTRSARP